MSHQPPTFLTGSQASLPDVAVLATILVAVVIDVAWIKYCLDDLGRRVSVTGGDKRFWAAVIHPGRAAGPVRLLAVRARRVLNYRQRATPNVDW